MTNRLVAIDMPAGPGFVEELQRIWSAGDAAFPVDQRLRQPAKTALLATMRVGEPVEPGDAVVVATSGSTGEPKGVVLTHDAVAASAEATSRRLGVTTDDHWLACLPLSHVGGLSVVTRALHVGTKLTVLPGFDAHGVDASTATLVSLVATTLAEGAGRPVPGDRARREPPSHRSASEHRHDVRDDRDRQRCRLRRRSARRRRGPDRTDGQILLRAPMLLRCYRDGTVPLDAEGWFATGDLGRWLDDGRLHVEGRRGDLIITGGENVWPEAVEAALADHPDIAEVMVRGVDDPEWGQLVEAVIVARDSTPTLESVRAHVKEHHPAFMAPKQIQIVSSLPRTSIGKLRRGGEGDEAQPAAATPAPPSMT